jgi:hypothetical protein
MECSQTTGSVNGPLSRQANLNKEEESKERRMHIDLDWFSETQ